MTVTEAHSIADDDSRLRSGLPEALRDKRSLSDYFRLAGLTPPGFQVDVAADPDQVAPEMTPPWLETIVADVETAPETERTSDEVPLACREAPPELDAEPPEPMTSEGTSSDMEAHHSDEKAEGIAGDAPATDTPGGIYGLRNRLIEAEQLLHELEHQEREPD